MENAEEYWITARGITGSDGARGKKHVWHPHVRTWGLSEANVLHWSTVLVTLLRLFGALIVIRRPGNCARCPPSLHPWLLGAATRLNKTMVHSSNQRHTGTLGFRGRDFQFARIFAPLWGKRIEKFCRAVVLLKQLAQTYREVFPVF